MTKILLVSVAHPKLWERGTTWSRCASTCSTGCWRWWASSWSLSRSGTTPCWQTSTTWSTPAARPWYFSSNIILSFSNRYIFSWSTSSELKRTGGWLAHTSGHRWECLLGRKLLLTTRMIQVFSPIALNSRFTSLILKYIVFTVETGYVCWAGVENIDDLRPLAPGSQGRVLSPTRQIDPPAAKFMTNSIKITKRLSEIKNDKKC